MYEEREVAVKEHEIWNGTQKFFLDGKIMVGKKYRNLIGTIFLINLPNLIHFIFAIQTQAVMTNFLIFMQRYSFSESPSNPILLLIVLGLWISSNYFLYLTAFSDPGFIPRQPENEHTQNFSRVDFRNYIIIGG